MGKSYELGVSCFIREDWVHVNWEHMDLGL